MCKIIYFTKLFSFLMWNNFLISFKLIIFTHKCFLNKNNWNLLLSYIEFDSLISKNPTDDTNAAWSNLILSWHFKNAMDIKIRFLLNFKEKKFQGIVRLGIIYCLWLNYVRKCWPWCLFEIKLRYHSINSNHVLVVWTKQCVSSYTCLLQAYNESR